MTKKDNSKKSVFSRILKSFKNMFVMLFGFGKSKNELMNAGEIQSPRKVAFNNFRNNKLAMSGVVLFVSMTLIILIGSTIVPIDNYETEPSMRNLAPSRSYLKVPSKLKKNGIDKISSGIHFSIGLDKEGEIYVWGSKANDIDEFPEEMIGKKVIDIAAGDRHAVAITEDKKVYAWGLNSFEQGSFPDRLESVMMLQDPVAVYAGDTYSAVLTTKDELYVWGSTLSTGIDIVPTRDQGELVDASATAFNMLLLRKDGQISFVGQKGTQISNIPEKFTDGSFTFTQVAAAQDNGLALDNEGKLHAWGASDGNRLSVIPAELKDKTFVDIDAGRYNFTAIDDQGELYSWGSNKFGQTTLPKSLDGKNVVGVDSDFYQNFAYTEDGEVAAWGNQGFLFGSDDFGRDIGTRLLHGGLITMFVGAIAVLISTVIGVTVGLIAGFYGGVIDNILMRVAEIINSFPFLPLAITLSTILSGSLSQAQRLAMIMVILGVLSWPGLARLIRGQILAEREKDFVLAARALGLPNKTIILKHILPSVVNIIIVNMTLSYAGSLLTESGLSFLGFGVALPQPSWGNMLIGSQDSRVIEVYWWRWLFPALSVLLAALSVNLIGDGMREALDPKSNEK